MDDRRPRTIDLARVQRALALLGQGALLALVGRLACDAWERAAARPGRVVLWLADRDGHALVGLDARWLRSITVDLEWPVEVEARADGGAWVARSTTGQPVGEHRLLLLDAGGEAFLERRLGTLLDLDLLGDGDALVVERPLAPGAVERVLRVDAEGGETPETLVERPGTRVAACAGRELLLASAGGGLASYDLGQEPGGRATLLCERRLAGAIMDLAPGPRAGTWWVLEEDEGARLSLLAADLAAIWSARVPGEPRRLAPVPRSERAWLASTSGRGARRVGPRGALELELADLGQAGVERGAAWVDGALWAAPGALLHVDGQGRGLPGQGGFAYLVDLSLVPAAAEGLVSAPR